MTVQELIEISTLSSGTITNLTGFSDYEEQEFFIQWAFTEMFNGTLNGQAAAFGSGPFEACKKPVYKKIRNLQNEVSRLKEILTIRNKSDLRLCERVSELKEQLSSAFDKQQEYVDNAMKFRKIQELLS